ncbi:orotidine 5-phosphate decarboxylase [Blastocystis sp. subtype 4]|uniref:orotidine 5-phosphate decarboxylase n=1 Tax=Blastocystis sp. subtype 4 TaxID=944170 RepID=UPI000711F553|nr:orotidine 5-phosphate decarboxylase [Blastocystis sp. subtype 4]KNB42354.1 orotidine 5-phosphate decarboxylase [Blastocystis sp. subtype 4]|eukprot:XP_014525797.1 orotidine 5-phosphate decarboxylase [Blastocystis sp. subtype 4]
MLEARIEKSHSLLCVGLDPHGVELAEHTPEGLKAFCSRLIEATKDVACCYKPNSAFFEAIPGGVEALAEIVKTIPEDIPVLLDVKRGDISTTAQAYATAAKQVGAHGVTLNAYMGYDAIKPFLEEDWGGCFILCKTSNPTSNEFQILRTRDTDGEERFLYEIFARKAAEWGTGVVVGATDGVALRNVRALCPSIWILAPGVGAQGGDLDDVIRAAIRDDGKGIVVPISRGISRAEDPRKAAIEYRDQINDAIARVLAERKQNETSLSNIQVSFIEAAIRANVLRFGEFKLKSGRLSPYFFNMGNFKTGLDLHEVAACYAQTILASDLQFDVLFGPAYKGIPLAATVAAELAVRGRNVEFAYNRKEAKDHGEGGCIVGSALKDKRVLVIDDVITAGTATRESVSIINAEGGQVVGLIIALDRQEKGNEGNLSAVQQIEKDFSFPVVSIVNLNALVDYLNRGGELSNYLDAIKKYREMYGA